MQHDENNGEGLSGIEVDEHGREENKAQQSEVVESREFQHSHQHENSHEESDPPEPVPQNQAQPSSQQQSQHVSSHHEQSQEQQNPQPIQPNPDRKNARKNSSQSVRQSKQMETPQVGSMSTGKKCFNKLCLSKKIFKKIRSRVEQNKYRFLCKNCYQMYTKNQFCEYCEQIYNNQELDEEELNRWVGCDNCDRWNHIQCERKFRNPEFKMTTKEKYECLACSRKGRTFDEGHKKKVEKDYEGVYGRSARGRVEINKDQRVEIFHKKPQSFINLQPFLQSYNFRLWLNESQIRDDIDTLRTLLRRPPLQEQPKKVKKVKQD